MANVYEARIYGYLVKETAAAVLFEVHALAFPDNPIEPVKEWFPLSQISRRETQAPDNQPEFDWMDVTNWILSKKGLV